MMADLRLTVRNLYCYPCDLSFSDQDSFRNHHNSPSKIPSHSISTDVKIETNEYVESDEIESSSPRKNKQRTKRRRKKSVDMEMENAPAVKRARSKISPIKSKSKRMPSDENQNENTENNNKSIKIRIKSKSKEKKDSVLQTSNKINLSKYKDYIHCCKCFSTFYTLPDLINHFDKCNIQRDESDNFKDFKQKSHSSSHQVKPTKTTTTEDEEENQLLNDDDFGMDNISLSPFTPDNNNDDDDEGQEEKMSKNDDNCSTTENRNFKSSSQTVEDQNEDSSDSEIKSDSDSGSDYEPEEEKGGKKNSKGTSQQRMKPNEELPLKCPVESCSSLSFLTIWSFVQHKRQVHNISIESKNPPSVLCPTCGKSVAGQFNLLCHMNEHTGYKPYKCTFENCDASFMVRDSFRRHVYITHKIKTGRLKCPDKTGCDQAFPTTTELRRHLKSCHAGSIFYKCQYCDEEFLTSDDRKNHRHKVHGEYKFKCEVENCGKSFKRSSGLRHHRLVHQSAKPFECDFPGCGAKYKDNSSLRQHNKVIHQNKEQCLCPECGKSFRSFFGYRKHLLVHTQEKSHICQYCGRGFNFLENLKAHTLIHSGEKPKKCRFCEKSFRQWGNLTRHEQTHTKINPYKCAFCDAVFPDNKPLKKHVATAHADEEFDLNIASTYQREKPGATRNPIPIPVPETVEEPWQNTETSFL